MGGQKGPWLTSAGSLKTLGGDREADKIYPVGCRVQGRMSTGGAQLQFQVEHALDLLARTPAQLRALLEGLGDPFIFSNEGGDTFSPYDVMGHLIHGERTDWIPRAWVILEHGPAVPFEPFDRFAMYESSQGKTLTELLDEFERLRNDNLQELEQMELTEEELAKRGTHPELGSVTLGELLATWVVHDLTHIRQILRTIAHQYRDQVGPWKPYLSILQS